MGPDLQFEHLALNVADPPAVAAWYSEHLGLKILRKINPKAAAHFLADSGGRVMLEIYKNPDHAVPDYPSMDPQLLHIAFVAEDVPATRERLIAAGASAAGGVDVAENGDVLTMLRDPWGLALQLCKRSESML